MSAEQKRFVNLWLNVTMASMFTDSLLFITLDAMDISDASNLVAITTGNLATTASDKGFLFIATSYFTRNCATSGWRIELE